MSEEEFPKAGNGVAVGKVGVESVLVFAGETEKVVAAGEQFQVDAEAQSEAGLGWQAVGVSAVGELTGCGVTDARHGSQACAHGRLQGRREMGGKVGMIDVQAVALKGFVSMEI